MDGITEVINDELKLTTLTFKISGTFKENHLVNQINLEFLLKNK